MKNLFLNIQYSKLIITFFAHLFDFIMQTLTVNIQDNFEQDVEEIESGKIEMLSQEQYDNQMNNFFDDLKVKYAN